MYYHLPPTDYHPTYSNASPQEGTLSPDSYHYFGTQTPDSYQYPSTRGSPQLPEDGVIPTSDYPPIFNDINVTQEYPHSFDTRDYIPHPIQGMVAINEYDGTITKVFGPPLPQILPNGPDFRHLSQDLRVVVPQLAYACGNTQKSWDQKPVILFFTRGRLGVKLSNAVNEDFKGIDERDEFPFDANCRGITIRMHFLGYPSSTYVEKILKQRADRGGSGRSKARSMQLSTKNYKVPPDPITKSKLAQEVSKRIEWHIRDLWNNSDLFPFDNRVGEQWRLGQGKMKFEHMAITGLENVSAGSWSPTICIE